jgi:hypothetical protein
MNKTSGRYGAGARPCFGRGRAGAGHRGQGPVVVELFTSQGCGLSPGRHDDFRTCRARRRDRPVAACRLLELPRLGRHVFAGRLHRTAVRLWPRCGVDGGLHAADHRRWTGPRDGRPRDGSRRPDRGAPRRARPGGAGGRRRTARARHPDRGALGRRDQAPDMVVQLVAYSPHETVDISPARTRAGWRSITTSSATGSWCPTGTGVEPFAPKSGAGRPAARGDRAARRSRGDPSRRRRSTRP